jgi:ATP-dependent DNA helicase RecG
VKGAESTLTQRERITLGLLAQSEGLRAVELAQQLGLPETNDLRAWLGNLVERGLVNQVGRTKGTRYFVPPDLLRRTGLDTRTTLRRVEPHRLRALIFEDVERYPRSSIREIHERNGAEIPPRTMSRALRLLVSHGDVVMMGRGRWARYLCATSMRHPEHGGG